MMTIGFSPCPNDTFIFDAMVHHKIDTEGLEFDVVLADVEELNNRAFREELDITKLSYHAFTRLYAPYILLNSGSALGNNCGPLLIAKTFNADWKDKIKNTSIAIPGKNTTANFLLHYAFPELSNTIETLFSEIEQSVISGKTEAGVIIHENRFTYQEKGLIKLMDLGEHWEKTTGFPIPLGGIVTRRRFPADLQQKIDRVLRRSIEFAFRNPAAVMPFVSANAQEMEEKVMLQHIALYVNDYSIDLGEKGKNAVRYLFEKALDGNTADLLPLFV
ncbi:MAG: 1,4-dihydroxy-6-naphthoate synthase [Saprospiraceae bacterium]